MKIRENLKKGTVELILLHLLLEGDKYGYQLAQEMEKRSKGKYFLGEGTLYPLLYRMIDKKLITDRQVLVGRRRTRVYYHIESEGVEYLDEITAEYNSITEGISNILTYRSETE